MKWLSDSWLISIWAYTTQCFGGLSQWDVSMMGIGLFGLGQVSQNRIHSNCSPNPNKQHIFK